MCSITPPIITSPVWSRSASTSTSIASSRKRSMSAGRSADSPPSRPSEPRGRELRHRGVEALGVEHDLHRAATEHVRGSDQDREADPAPRSPARPARSSRCRPAAAGSPSRSHSALKRSRSSARSIDSGLVPTIGMPACWSAWASLSGVWPPSATITPRSSPSRLQRVAHVAHALHREGLEEQPVAGVVVGRHRLRVAVDHHGLEPGLRRARTRRARSSSRTRHPARCGWGRCRG